MDLIDSVSLSSATSSVTFSSISQDYDDLYLRFNTRDTTTSSSTRGDLKVTVNSITQYNMMVFYWLDQTADGVFQASAPTLHQPDDLLRSQTDGSELYNTGFYEFRFPNYTGTTLNKTVIYNGGYKTRNTQTNGDNYGQYGFGTIVTTDAISSITIDCNANLAQYSTFYLYGTSY